MDKNTRDQVCELARKLAEKIANSGEDQITLLNMARQILHDSSPFRNEPVDCIVWVPYGKVTANDYNPNLVAPPEMELLRHSIAHDGYTQPIVSWDNGTKYEVVDGFHRSRVGQECDEVKARLNGHLPLTVINDENTNRTDRIASTIRHNRARGKHKIEGMSDIVIELKRRNWKTPRICRELGMEEDEVLRLCQITGLTDIFEDQEFSKAWDVEGHIDEADFEELTDNTETYQEDLTLFRTVNTSDPDRIFHTHDKWECEKAGFYNKTVDGKTKDECKEEYRAFLADLNGFEKALRGVTTEWKYSCEHYLTNKAMNRIAWLGQASMCYATGIPSEFRSGFNLLTEEQQQQANEMALKYLNKWLKKNKREAVTMEEAMSFDRQSEIY
jgi:ParB-like chromosome segregation protein Spo0J